MSAALLRRALVPLAIWLAVLAGADAKAQTVQPSGVVTLNQERFFNKSAFGQRVLRELETLKVALAAENRGIEDVLIKEEQELTDRRPSLEPEEFRELADAFDAKVEGIRKAQAQKAVDLNAWLEAEQKRFFEAAFPVLVTLADEMGASVVLDQRSTLIALDRSDITTQAIERIDLALKDGTGQP